MATPKRISGANVIYRAPAEEADRVGDLAVFANRGGLTSAWALSDAEIDEIIRTRTIYLNVMGHALPPVFVGSESEMRALSLDMGGVLPPQD